MSESKFILNNTKDNIKVISTIESNLKQVMNLLSV